MLNVTGFSHPEREAQGSVVGLKSHWSSLLQDGLMGCVQALTNSRCRVVVVMMSRRSVVIVVHRLVGVIVLLLPKQVGVQVSAGVKICLFEE